MKLIITESCQSAGYFDLPGTIQYLSAADNSFLESVDEVFFHDQFGSNDPIPGLYPDLRKEAIDEVRAKIIKGDLVLAYPPAFWETFAQTKDAAKISNIVRLLDTFHIITDKDFEDPAFREKLQNSEVCFYYPLCQSRILPFMRTLPNISGYMYLNESETRTRVGFRKIDNLNLFFEVDERLGIITNNIYENPESHDPSHLRSFTDLIDAGIIRHPGYYLSGRISNKNPTSNRRICFIGDYENVVRWSIEYFLSAKKNYFQHDCKEGLPDNIPANYDTLVLINVDKLSVQKQNILVAILKAYHFWNEHIVILHSSGGDLIPELINKSEFTLTPEIIHLPKIQDLKQDLTVIFYSILWQTDFFNSIPQLTPQEISDNIFADLLEVIDSVDLLYPVINLAGHYYASDIWDVGFWFNIALEARHQIECRDKIAESKPTAEKTKEYRWVYRGAFWEVSFGYKEPLLIDSLYGMFYIAHLMNTPGQKWDISELNRHVTKTFQIEYDMDTLRKNIREVIDNIKSYEEQMSLGDDLSQYLRAAFIPNSPSLKSDRYRATESAFDSTFNTCGFFLTEPSIEWKISTPFLIKSGPKGKKAGPTKGKKKNKK